MKVDRNGNLPARRSPAHSKPSVRLSLPGGPLPLDRTLLLGILNITPDSFSDGGRWVDVDRAVAHGLAMRAQGADVIDVGGESTRPGAEAVTEAEEKRRVLPVIKRLGGLVSIDTSKASVAEAALRAGAAIVNDVSAFGDRRMARVVARAGAAILLMHRKGTPRTMQRNPVYRDVVEEILVFLRRRVKRALSAGIPRDRIIVDPGIGFGKRPEHNLEILRRLREFRRLGFPICVGTSRKNFIGHVLGREVHERLYGTAATVAAAVLRGAHLVRVHDVAEMAEVARMCDRLK